MAKFVASFVGLGGLGALGFMIIDDNSKKRGRDLIEEEVVTGLRPVSDRQDKNQTDTTTEIHDTYEARVARRLSKNNVFLCGTTWCGWCPHQLNKFGEASSLVPYKDCTREGRRGFCDECLQMGIQVVPSWATVRPNGEVLVVRGSQEIESLDQLCDYLEDLDKLENSAQEQQ